MKKTACIIGLLIAGGFAGASAQAAPVSASQCPIELRHGVREPVCASQAISPATASSPAQALPAAAVRTTPAPAATVVSAVPAAVASAPAAAPQTQAITKDVGEDQVNCRIPRPEYSAEAQQRHQTGKVVVRITIWPPHVVKQLTLNESSGNASFDAAAMRAAEGTECADTVQRFQIFQTFEFDLWKDAGARPAENATALAQ
ncbi:TonB family protein [Trinickia sp. NRRL B-1857]|uniref:TonB family protein n=1 Tax=Trinickia sp. NRRL B-1857 TaxID=3162879 RepID=UPI003D2C4805